MRSVTIHAAKTHLSALLAEVEAGEEIVIARGPTPIARLVPLEAPVRRFGAMKGRIVVDDRFFEPLPDDELDAWGG